MNQSFKPKAEFQKTQFSKSLEGLVVDQGFRNACQQSLFHYLISLRSSNNTTTPTINDTTEAAANWHRVEGAFEAIDTLLNLAEIPKPPDKRTDFNLKT